MSKKNIAYIVISVLVTIAFILLAALVFKTSYIRIFESLTDLIHSIKYYFCKLFGIDAELNPSILDSSNVINGSRYFHPTLAISKSNSLSFGDCLRTLTTSYYTVKS